MNLRYQSVSLCMRDAEVTIEKILEKSGILFNTQGYKATSISDITELTGLTKGAIYRHFENKNDLEKKALYHLSSSLDEKMRTVIKAQPTAGKKLRAIFNFFDSYISDPPIAGGCPLLNAAIEADDTNPLLRAGVVKVLNKMQKALTKIVVQGQQQGEFKPVANAEQFAILFISMIEGGIMVSKAYGNPLYLNTNLKQLRVMIQEMKR